MKLTNLGYQRGVPNIDEYSKLYQNFLFLGDFNASISEKCLEEFCNLNGLTSLIKKPTCLKNPDKADMHRSYLSKSTKLFSTQ